MQPIIVRVFPKLHAESVWSCFSPKGRFLLQLRQKVQIAIGTYDFVFTSDRKIVFVPGQYLEWTLAHKYPDQRGIRRYFTIASSPNENEVKMGVKFYEKPSSYKQALQSLEVGENIVASQLSGNFTLPRNRTQKLVFLAGGIGITPFRSMIVYLLHLPEKRDIEILYANKRLGDIAYKEIFDRAQKELGVKTIYFLTDLRQSPTESTYQSGPISKEFIMERVKDYRKRIFYISGPRSMIVDFTHTLSELQIPHRHIKTDFFPGFA